MTKFQKIVLGIVTVITVMLLSAALVPNSSKVGGVYNQVTKYFYDGINVGTNSQFTISSLGVLVSSGGATIGSTTAGLNSYKTVTTLTADTTITNAASGTIYNIGTAGVDVTLPAPTAANGVHYRFVVSANFATTAMTIVAGTADTLEGSLLVAGAVVDCDAGDLISISATNENIGDFVDVFSNGTNWIIGASGALAASVLSCTG
jgi:hypothetical protein